MSTFAPASIAFEQHADESGSHSPRRAARGTGLSLLEVLVLAIVLALLIAGVVATRCANATAVHDASVRVERGQTLWGLAESHPVRGLSTAQTAELIAQLNNLGTKSLVAHTVVRVPASETSAVFASR